MNEIGVTGITITNVLGCGVQKGAPSYYRGVEMEMNLLPKVKIEIVVSLVPVQKVIETARQSSIPVRLVMVKYLYMTLKMSLRSVQAKKVISHCRIQSKLFINNQVILIRDISVLIAGVSYFNLSF